MTRDSLPLMYNEPSEIYTAAAAAVVLSASRIHMDKQQEKKNDEQKTSSRTFAILTRFVLRILTPCHGNALPRNSTPELEPTVIAIYSLDSLTGCTLFRLALQTIFFLHFSPFFLPRTYSLSLPGSSVSYISILCVHNNQNRAYIVSIVGLVAVNVVLCE